MQIVQARGREIPVTTRSKRYTPERARAEALFNKPAFIAKPRILEDQPKVATAGLATRAIAVKPASPNETEHERVFRLVQERQFENAARIAARLINADNDDGFFVFGNTQEFDKAKAWHRRMIIDGEPHANVHIITPERAQILLLNNEGNRRVRSANLAKIMRDIADGRFEVNGESIIVCKDGSMNDGQHRSFGVLLTGKTIETVVSYGVTKRSMRTVDIGDKRQAKDRLAVAGIADYVRLSAIAAFAFETYNGRAPTPSEVDDYFHDNREKIEQAAAAAGTPVKGAGPSVCGVAALHLMAVGYGADDINEFFRKVRNGEDMKRGNPALLLHRALFNSEHKIKLSRENWLRAFVHHFVVWNAGGKLKAVVFDQDIQKAA